MSTPRLLTNDYTIVANWFDGNPDKEDRVGYFVSKDSETSGVTINKATSSSEILGVTIPSVFACANVGILGVVTVRDNGECIINDRCKSSNDGIAIPSDKGYLVVDRIDDSHIRILIESSTSNKIDIKVEGKVLCIGG